MRSLGGCVCSSNGPTSIHIPAALSRQRQRKTETDRDRETKRQTKTESEKAHEFGRENRRWEEEMEGKE